MPTTTSPRRRTRRTFVLASLVAVVAATTAVDARPAAAVPLPVNIEGFQDGLYMPIDDVVLGDAGDASVVANGNLAVTWAGANLEPTFDEDGRLTEFDSDLGLRGALTLELAAQTAGDLDGTLEVLTVPLTEFPAGPVTVIPYLGIDVQFSGHAEAGAQLSLVAPFDVSAAIAKLGGRPTASAAESPSFEPEIGLPDAANALAFHAEVELDISVTFMMLLNGVPIGGPALIAALGAQLDVNLAARPWWSLDGTAGLKYAWATPDPAGLPQLPRRPPSLFPAAHFPIAHAHDDGPVADVATRWSRAFDVANSDIAGAVLPIGERLVVAENASSPWMATLDGTGIPIWQHTNPESSGSEAAGRSAGGSLLTAGRRGSGGLRTGSFDSVTGSQDWFKEVFVADATSAVWPAITPTTGGALIGGAVRRGTTAVERPTLVAVDDSGGVSVTEIDPGQGSGDAAIIDMVGAPDGTLLAVGNVAYALPDRSIDQGNVLIMRLEPDGTPIASRVLGGRFSDVATGVAVQPDGSYAISGQTVDGAGGATRPWVASFDADDDLLWSSLYADGPDGRSARATGITTVAGGDYVVTGTTGTTAKDAWMIRLDDTGMPLWSKSYVGAGEDELTGVVTVGSGVAAAGHTNTTNPAGNSFKDLWLVRTNRDGMLHFDAASGFDTVNGAVQWQYTTNHTVVALVPTSTTPPVTVTDAPMITTPGAAIDLPLT
jgi:hypothetical protein